MTWDEYYLGMASLVSRKSKDPSTKCGAVIVAKSNAVLSIGFNGFPRGVAEVHTAPALPTEGKLIAERWERPQKYRWVVHAEMNAILNAARHGISLEGSRLYTTTLPCSECVKAIIQAGIKEVISIEQVGVGTGTHWFHDDIERTMFMEARVILRVLPRIPTDVLASSVQGTYG